MACRIERETSLLPINTLFLDHVRWLRRAAKAHGAEILVELDSMRAFVRHAGRHWVMHPQFLTVIDGRQRYISVFSDAATHFAGWRPHPHDGWPASKDKLVFKRAARQLGLAVPDIALDGTAQSQDVVVKRAVGSFGEHVHGPYRSSAERPLRIAEGEFYEQFVEGEHLKVWYWGAQVIGMERDPAANVVGDGTASIRELIDRHLALVPGVTEAKLDKILARCAAMLRFDGLDMTHVPAAGQVQRVEFRYGSDLMKRAERQIVDLQHDASPQWEALRAAGPLLRQMIPDDVPSPTLFAIDAVRTPEGRILLLEMNANPIVNPLAYDAILASFVAEPLAAPAARAAAQPTPTLN